MLATAEVMLGRKGDMKMLHDASKERQSVEHGEEVGVYVLRYAELDGERLCILIVSRRPK